MTKLHGQTLNPSYSLLFISPLSHDATRTNLNNHVANTYHELFVSHLIPPGRRLSSDICSIQSMKSIFKSVSCGHFPHSVSNSFQTRDRATIQNNTIQGGIIYKGNDCKSGSQMWGDCNNLGLAEEELLPYLGLIE